MKVRLNMKSLIYFILLISAMYLFADTFLYYLDCDIMNVLPEHNHLKTVALCITVLALYLMSDDNKGGQK